MRIVELSRRLLPGAAGALLLAGGIMGAGCAGSGPGPGSAATGRASEDTSLFAAVARAIVPHPGVELEVDPVPLRADPSVTSVDAATRAAASPERVRANERALEALRVAAGDASRYAGCPGVLVAPPKSTAGCPKELLLLVAIGLPRRGGPFLPGSVDERARYAGREVVAVRAIEETVGPLGKSTEMVDYVMSRAGGGWRLVERRGLLYVE